MGGGDDANKQAQLQMSSLIPYSGGNITQASDDATEQGHFERMMDDLEARMRARAGVGEIGWADSGGFQF